LPSAPSEDPLHGATFRPPPPATASSVATIPTSRLASRYPLLADATLQITVIREIPAYAGFYTGYELTKRYFSRHFTPDPVPIWALLCSGAVGGVSYWLACYPLDVVKSRIQLAKEPPTRGGWLRGGYVAKELATIVHEGGV
jgi:hypothetical protein